MFRAVSFHHQESGTIHTTIGSQHNLSDLYHCCVYSARLLMMDRDTVRNM